MRYRASRLALLIPAMVALALAGATVAGAHSEYARSVPAANARIPRAPARIDVWFTQELFRRAGANTLTVLAEDGRRMDDGQAAIDGGDRTQLSVTLLEPLGPGTYRVEWASLSAIDGDTAQGAFSFTVDPTAPEPEPTAARSSSPPADESRSPSALAGGRAASMSWIAIAVSAAVLSALLFTWAARTPFEEQP